MVIGSEAAELTRLHHKWQYDSHCGLIVRSDELVCVLYVRCEVVYVKNCLIVLLLLRCSSKSTLNYVIRCKFENRYCSRCL